MMNTKNLIKYKGQLYIVTNLCLVDIDDHDQEIGDNLTITSCDEDWE